MGPLTFDSSSYFWDSRKEKSLVTSVFKCLFPNHILCHHQCWLRERIQCVRSRSHEHMVSLLMQHTCAFKFRSSPISYIPLPSENVVPLCMLDFTALWVRWHLMSSNRQLRLHANLVTHGQAFSFYSDPAATQKLFLKRRIVIHRGWQGFLPKS